MRTHFKIICFLLVLFGVATVNGQSAEIPRYNGQPNLNEIAQSRSLAVGNSESLNYHLFLPVVTRFGRLAGDESETIRTAILLSADLNQPTHTISPYIYGANLVYDPSIFQQWQLPLNRWGGNALTRYNWRLDVFNAGNHQFYENLFNSDPGTLPNNSAADQFVERNRQYHTASYMQTSIIGWTPTDRSPRCGFSVNKYGQQTSVDAWYAIAGCGNGISSATNSRIISDPYDTSVPVDENNTREWVQHLVSRYGKADAGGVQFYALDNEPMLWHWNHGDIHPQLPDYEEVVTKGIRNAVAIKSADPTTKIVGPSVWGWIPYFRSAVDLADPNMPDLRRTGLDFLPYYLQEMRRFEEQNGYRLLDYLDVHYYAQGYIDGVPIWEDSIPNDPVTNALRLRSTKDLWDRNYVSESWINQPTYVIPRLKAWIDQYYPGTKLSFSEYRWGGFDLIEGALTQADLLGIFGREDVGMAMVWDAPKLGTPGDYAFRIYRNYDNRGSTFGDVSLLASSSNQDLLSIYAAKRSADGATTLVVINKAAFEINSDIALAGAGNNRSAQLYQYSSADLTKILTRPNVTFANGFANYIFPAYSITLFVLPQAAAPQPITHVVYEDAYSADWENWSWNTTVNPAQRAIVKNGNQAISISHNTGWSGYYLHANRDIVFSRSDQLEFWVHGGSGGQNVELYLVHKPQINNYGNTVEPELWGTGVKVPIVAGSWQKVTVSFNDIAPVGRNLFNGIVLFNATSSRKSPFYIDDLRYISNP